MQPSCQMISLRRLCGIRRLLRGIYTYALRQRQLNELRLVRRVDNEPACFGEYDESNVFPNSARGAIYINHIPRQWCLKHGIVTQTAPIHVRRIEGAPEEYEIVERAQEHIIRAKAIKLASRSLYVG